MGPFSFRSINEGQVKTLVLALALPLQASEAMPLTLNGKELTDFDIKYVRDLTARLDLWRLAFVKRLAWGLLKALGLLKAF